MTSSTSPCMITVAIPAFNAGDYLAECLNSVLAQTYAVCEIIVVDNGSTDNTLSLAEDYARKHPGLIRVVSESQSGAPYARNKALELAKGKWIQFLDADDLLLPDKFELQMAGDSAAHIKTCSATLLYPEGRRVLHTALEDPWLGLFLGGGKLGFTSCILWDVEKLRAIGGWDTSYTSSQEYELLFRMMKNGSDVDVLDESLVIKRERNDDKQISRANLPRAAFNYMRLRHEIFRYIRSNSLLDKRTQRTLRSQYARRYHYLRMHLPDKKSVMWQNVLDMHDGNRLNARITLVKGLFRYVYWWLRLVAKNQILVPLSKFAPVRYLYTLLIKNSSFVRDVK